MLPFADSRRLTGANLFFATTGAVLEFGATDATAAVLDGWRARVARARAHLCWEAGPIVARAHAIGVSLALAAPIDALYVATEVNEWALCATLAEREPARTEALLADLYTASLEEAADPLSVIAPVLDEPGAFKRLSLLAAREANPRLRALVGEAMARDIAFGQDETALHLGAGRGARHFALQELPSPATLPWAQVKNVPTALVTGSNGKTTTVRLIAACASAHGWCAGYNCTDGVYIGKDVVARGDYSGPSGARLVLDDARVEAAILETARGGMLRRGIAASRADLALVTNVAKDHFGEFGIDDLAGLAEVKLSVAGVLGPHGLLLLNADDALLCDKAQGLSQRFGREFKIGWFAHDYDAKLLRTARAARSPVAGVRAGRLIVSAEGAEHDIGAIDLMPLSVGGAAAYNVENLMGAALASLALRIAPGTIREVYARFGAEADDNPGRMMRFVVGGVEVLIDYAHNPDGLRGLLGVARRQQRDGRLGLLLGHAGNRKDEDIIELARTAAEFAPDLIVVKENVSQLRGRQPGEIPKLLHSALLKSGVPEAHITLAPSEIEAARVALAWAKAGDVLALPLHAAASREAVLGHLRDGAPLSAA